MEALNFTNNWNNKLDCKCFTTLRLENPKYKVGYEVMVTLNAGATLGRAKIIDVKELYLDKINNFIAHLDTGMNVEDTKALIIKMYPQVNFIYKKLYLILLEYQNND